MNMKLKPESINKSISSISWELPFISLVSKIYDIDGSNYKFIIFNNSETKIYCYIYYHIETNTIPVINKLIINDNLLLIEDLVSIFMHTDTDIIKFNEGSLDNYQIQKLFNSKAFKNKKFKFTTKIEILREDELPFTRNDK